MTKLYTIHDTVAQVAGPVFPANNDAHALRLFRDILRNDPSVSSDDMRLVCLGLYSSHTDERLMPFLVSDANLEDYPYVVTDATSVLEELGDGK